MRHAICRPLVIVALLIGFLLLRAALFAITTASEHALYFDYATQARSTSLAEIHRARDIEYPPLATVFGVVVLYVADALPDEAVCLTRWRPEPTRGGALARYEVALGLVLFAVDATCLALVHFIGKWLYPRDGSFVHLARLVLYVAATTAQGLILYDRQDLVVAFVAVMAVGAVARGWSLPAYLVLAAGTAYKLIPILLLPLSVLAFAALHAGRGSTRQFVLATLREALIAGMVLAIVPLLMYVLCGGERAFVFLDFHSTRGLQVEASTAWPLFLFDSTTELGHSFGSYTLRGELADRIARLTTPLTLLVFLFALFVSARGFWRIRDCRELTSHFVASSLLVWLGFILCTKVGSPQYLLWLAPLAALLPFGRAERWWLVLLLASMVVTTLIYPCLYTEVKGTRIGDELIWTGPNPLGLTLLAAKSILLGASFTWLAVLVWRGRWSVG
jgi:hypothetical protein